MDSYLTFTPPQLPPLMSAGLLSKHVLDIYPELQAEESHIADVASAISAYELTAREYAARNAHYAEWMQWYKDNPTQKDQVVTFAVEHHLCFVLSRTALEMLDRVVAAVIERWGDRQGFGTIRTLLTTVQQHALNLGENLKALRAASGPVGAAKIMPQKRPAASTP